ncbi:hypothetical protein BP6252_05883 [Coleophoma cylindrospora]|uniref:Major facilitator superfamily (MFS) profile domain-containing protein n=1 Tax=Coleophoma cylindrospora TaxID=1849047 RepID=A0A3D8RV59_9HELO|nr:hypothetical protein BP6252_05883 [Coleophoma cylindrospora]
MSADHPSIDTKDHTIITSRAYLQKFGSDATLISCSPVQSDLEKINDTASETSLPPIDGGKAAWMFMFGSVLIDAVIWGFTLNFGIFQDYYMTHPLFEGNKYIAVIGTLATGIAYLGGPLMAPIAIKYQQYRQQMVYFGVLTCICGTLGASFATKIWHLILCQGIVYGIGFLIVSYAVFSMLNDWFVKRRGLAYGIQLSASGIGGLVLPFPLQALLKRWGFSITLRIYAVTIVVIVGPALLLLRSRSPSTTTPKTKVKVDYSVMRKPIFFVLAIVNILQGLAYYLPDIYIPAFAADLSLSMGARALLLAMINLAQVLGLLTMGYLSDFIDIHLLLFFSSFGSAVVVFTLWGLGKTLAPLVIFSLLFGFMAGGFESLFPRFATALTKDPDTELTFYGMFEFERGVGIVLAGPICSGLMQNEVDLTDYGVGRYKSIVLLVGTALLVTSLGGLGWRFRGKSWYR